jgi:hypothetical protein
MSVGWHRKPGDQRRGFIGTLPRHRDLSHLEGEVAAMADDFRANFDQLLAQAGRQQRLRRLGHRQHSHEVAEM